jgi:GSCFA family
MKNSGTSGGGTMPELDLLKAFQHCTSLKTLAAKQDGKPTVRRLEKRFRLERLRAMLQELIRFIVPRKRVAKSAAPIVGHDGLWKDDVRLMELVVQSIFRTSSLNGNLVKILQHLNTNRAALETHEQLCEEVKTCLNLLKSRRTLSPAEEKRYFQALAEHRQTTLGNIRAYQGETKFNWRAIWYPDGSVPPPHGRSIYADEQLPYAQINRLVTRATPIGSAGSCFAAEIRSILIKEGFNYVTTEPNDLTCAAWGALYNVPSMRQLVEKAFGLARTPHLVAIKQHMKSSYISGFDVVDPFRQNVQFRSLEEYEEDYQRHLDAAREALLKCEFFILTLGMNEIWYLKSDGSVLTRILWDLSPALVDRRVLTVQENVDELNRMLQVWRNHNPGIKLIVTVSPVPLHATFQGDHTHVIAATCHAKSTLRVAAEEFVRQNKDVFYFPAYETVMYCTERPFIADNRHVTPEAVAKVARLFKLMFVKPDES